MRNNISTEELLKALESADSKEVEINDFNGFINAFNLKPGPNKIKTKALYNLYRKWSKDSIGQTMFLKNINLVFTSTKYTEVLINLEPLALIQLIGERVKKSTLTTNSPASKKHFESFIAKHEMEKGYLWIKFSVLLDVYTGWQKEGKFKTKFSKQTLMEFFNLYFDKKKDNKEMYYGFNPKLLLNFTHEQKLQCLSQKSKTNAIKKENQEKSN